MIIYLKPYYYRNKQVMIDTSTIKSICKKIDFFTGSKYSEILFKNGRVILVKNHVNLSLE